MSRVQVVDLLNSRSSTAALGSRDSSAHHGHGSAMLPSFAAPRTSSGIPVITSIDPNRKSALPAHVRLDSDFAEDFPSSGPPQSLLAVPGMQGLSEEDVELVTTGAEPGDIAMASSTGRVNRHSARSPARFVATRAKLPRTHSPRPAEVAEVPDSETRRTSNIGAVDELPTTFWKQSSISGVAAEAQKTSQSLDVGSLRKSLSLPAGPAISTTGPVAPLHRSSDFVARAESIGKMARTQSAALQAAAEEAEAAAATTREAARRERAIVSASAVVDSEGMSLGAPANNALTVLGNSRLLSTCSVSKETAPSAHAAGVPVVPPLALPLQLPTAATELAAARTSIVTDLSPRRGSTQSRLSDEGDSEFGLSDRQLAEVSTPPISPGGDPRRRTLNFRISCGSTSTTGWESHETTGESRAPSSRGSVLELASPRSASLVSQGLPKSLIAKANDKRRESYSSDADSDFGLSDRQLSEAMTPRASTADIVSGLSKASTVQPVFSSSSLLASGSSDSGGEYQVSELEEEEGEQEVAHEEAARAGKRSVQFAVDNLMGQSESRVAPARASAVRRTRFADEDESTSIGKGEGGLSQTSRRVARFSPEEEFTSQNPVSPRTRATAPDILDQPRIRPANRAMTEGSDIATVKCPTAPWGTARKPTTMDFAHLISKLQTDDAERERERLSHASVISSSCKSSRKVDAPWGIRRAPTTVFREGDEESEDESEDECIGSPRLSTGRAAAVAALSATQAHEHELILRQSRNRSESPTSQEQYQPHLQRNHTCPNDNHLRRRTLSDSRAAALASHSATQAHEHEISLRQSQASKNHSQECNLEEHHPHRSVIQEHVLQNHTAYKEDDDSCRRALSAGHAAAAAHNHDLEQRSHQHEQSIDQEQLRGQRSLSRMEDDEIRSESVSAVRVSALSTHPALSAHSASHGQEHDLANRYEEVADEQGEPRLPADSSRRSTLSTAKDAVAQSLAAAAAPLAVARRSAYEGGSCASAVAAAAAQRDSLRDHRPSFSSLDRRSIEEEVAEMAASAWAGDSVATALAGLSDSDSPEGTPEASQHHPSAMPPTHWGQDGCEQNGNEVLGSGRRSTTRFAFPLEPDEEAMRAATDVQGTESRKRSTAISWHREVDEQEAESRRRSAVGEGRRTSIAGESRRGSEALGGVDMPGKSGDSGHHAADAGWSGASSGRRASTRAASTDDLHAGDAGDDPSLLHRVSTVPLPQDPRDTRKEDEEVKAFMRRLSRQASQSSLENDEARKRGITDESHFEVSVDMLAHLYDGEVLFDMLDKYNSGSLHRRDARAWFRGLGWCLDDHTLDNILNEGLGLPGKPAVSRNRSSQSTSHPSGCSSPSTPHYAHSSSGGVASKTWRLIQLLKAAEQNFHLCGPDADSLSEAMRILVGERPVVHRGHLKHSTTAFEPHGGLTRHDFDELMGFCGVPFSAHALEVQALVGTMVDFICEPKAEKSGNVTSGAAARRDWHGGRRI